MARSFAAAFLFSPLFASALHAQDPQLDLAEAYALAEDRGKVVAALLAGSEEWYAYTCREHQARGDLDAVEPLLAAWTKRYGRTSGVIEAENRQALLGFARDPQRTFEFLRQRLDLRFDDRPDALGERGDLPTRLDPALISRDAWSQRARAAHPNSLEGFGDSALFWLGQAPLDDRSLHELLSRLERPDLPGLPALIVRDLALPGSEGFGKLRIHSLLRMEQLEQCAQLQPELWKEPEFIAACLQRLAPDADSAWLHHPSELEKHLARLWEFARPLPGVHNSLKAHVLYHWLALDLARGAIDQERLSEYLRLPRRGGHVVPAYSDRFHDREQVHLARGFPTRLAPIDDDEPLLRAYLEQVFARDERIEAYAELLDADWLRGVLAETRLLNGDPDAGRWSAMLGDRARVDALAQRVEIAFPPTARKVYAASDDVVLEADVKNVSTLLLKVFAIDAFRYYTVKDAELDESIELDGLVANFEQTFRYEELPMRRVRRRFELPILSQPGTFVVELIGNGVRSRALIRKGSLHHVERPGAAGHVFQVFDERGTLLTDASVWTGGREYGAGERGEILVPYSTAPGTHTVVLRQGERAARATFSHLREEYALHAPCHLDREALIAGARARLVLRPELELAERPIAVRLLEEPVLTLIATDLDGLATTQEVRDLALVDERELVHELTVPERLAQISVALRGRVTDLAGKQVELASPVSKFNVNGIDATSATASPQLLRSSEGYVIELRGKDGETKAGRAVALTLRARAFTDPFDITLQTDAAGRIALGELEGVRSVGFSHGLAKCHVTLRDAAATYPPSMHGLVGETLRVPYLGAETAPTRAAFSLLGEERDAFEHLTLADGFLELRDLAAGDYELELHETGTRIEVRVTQGTASAGWLIGRERMLQRTRNAPLAIPRVELAGDELHVHVANATSGTRLTLVATRFVPPFELFSVLNRMFASIPAPLALETPPAQSSYHAGLSLRDEIRYVLERRYAPKYPGNMLARPSWLLNRLDLDEVSDRYGVATGVGGAFASRRAGGGGKGRGGLGQGGGGGRGPGDGVGVAPGILANLDYLPAPSITLANLVPDASGLVRVPLAELGAGALVHVLALDGAQAVYRTLLRPETPLAPRPRHLAAALDEREHAIEQRRIEFVAAGGTAVIDEARTTKLARLDSLAAVHRLLLSISGDADLARFAFVVRWPELSRAEKLELYSRHACHELHFFLHQKDPAFFGEVVRPFLANKLHKTFLDHWLLSDELGAYLEPWAFGRLNLIERILLARRVDTDEREAITRGVREANALRPPDRERLQRLFELALANDALAAKQGAVPPESDDEEKLEGKATDQQTAAGPETPGPGAPPEITAEEEGPVNPEDALTGSDDIFLGRAEEAEQRKHVRRLYLPVEPTRRLIEHDYWHRAPDRSIADLVAPSAFWRDYALANPAQPFVSPAVAEASASFLEMMFALSLLDLPFAPGEPELQRDGARTTLTATTPFLLVRKETAPVGAASEAPTLLLGENFLRLDARTEVVDGVARDRFVAVEFLSDFAYACQVVVTNPTSSPRAVELLLQIPAGAVPVQKGFWTRGRSVELGPYSTQALEYAFYFPASGDYAHYPVHAAEKEKLAGAAAPRTLHVVDEPTQVDASSWEHVARHGSASDVLAHLDGANLRQLDLGRIAWRLREREFFAALVERLRSRHRYDDQVWSYGLFHGDERAAREYLEHQDAFVAACGAYLDSPLLRIDPLLRNSFLYVELDPLIHARAHHQVRTRLDLNPGLAAQYRGFLDVLGHKPVLDAEDWAMSTTYLLLQDRVDDALAAYAKIDPARLDSKLQHDYLGAYLCFFTEDVDRARALAEPYREHPVAHWRERFATVLSQLDEAAGKRPDASGTPSQEQLAATEPALELAGEGRALAVRYRNLAQCELRYYPLDVEVAFSARPFALADGQAAAFVQPVLAQVLALPADEAELALELPAQFATANVLVEVRAPGLARARTLFAHALDVRFLEAYGQVAVADPRSGAPLAKVYVKSFARLPDGTVRFHKDGYTDLRGRFDYVSVSNDPDLAAERFAVLVLSDELGADIRELAPPAR